MANIRRHGAMWFPSSFPRQVGGLQKKWFCATGVYALSSKYQHWYDELMDRAKVREIPTCYTEVHHITPRSLGGTDDSVNLVRLTYREHFVAHWLLTKIVGGGALRKMQRALFAMTMKVSGGRLVSSWQFEAAKRSVRDLELDPEAEREWYERWEASRVERIARFKAHQARAKKRRGRKPRRSSGGLSAKSDHFRCNYPILIKRDLK